MTTAFEVRGLVKRYGGRRQGVEALRGVSLRGAPGELVGLLGPNGAGKSTTVKCLAGLVRPTAGEATLLGRPAREADARRALGYVPEGPRFPAYLTAAELLDREGRLHGLERPVRRERTARLLERVALAEGVWTRRVGTYSKGERARLALALALVGDPRVLLLDEPTDGLDPVGRRLVRDLLVALRAEGRAVLLNSHLLSEVEACCDRVVVLDRGAVRAEGAPGAFLAGGQVVYRARLAAPLGAAARDALAARFPGLRGDGVELLAPLPDLEAVDPLVDALRAAGASLRELRPQATLEDALLTLLGADAPPGAPEGAGPPAAGAPAAAPAAGAPAPGRGA